MKKITDSRSDDSFGAVLNSEMQQKHKEDIAKNAKRIRRNYTKNSLQPFRENLVSFKQNMAKKEYRVT